jgi:hypothetical protein
MKGFFCLSALLVLVGSAAADPLARGTWSQDRTKVIEGRDYHGNISVLHRWDSGVYKREWYTEAEARKLFGLPPLEPVKAGPGTGYWAKPHPYYGRR